MNATPRVTLISSTRDPLETVYAVWQMSKDEKPLLTTDEIKATVPKEELEKLFRAIIRQRIPIGEHIDFIFAIENVSVSWREQAVRHRIGCNPSVERVGVDMVMQAIPNLAESSFWSQSMRLQDMGSFASNDKYRMPSSIEKSAHATEVYRAAMLDIENAYNILTSLGVPREDARELIPLGAQHRISWRLNIGALQHIVGERGCFILQLGIWGSVIEGMINELATKINPIFRELVTPPCIKSDKFAGCVYMEECRRRLDGEDLMPPCPLHYAKHVLPESKRDIMPLLLGDLDIPMKNEMIERASAYAKFWNRDPYSGGKL
jgi:thymidylate synthase (FAD)